MDILQKLRLAFWGLVLLLWCLFMYQFFKPEIGQRFPALTRSCDRVLLTNSYYQSLLQKLPVPLRPKPVDKETLASLGSQAVSSTTVKSLRLPQPHAAAPEPPVLTSRLVTGGQDIIGIAPRDSRDPSALSQLMQRQDVTEEVGEIADVSLQKTPHAAARKAETSLPPLPQWPAPPEGFASKTSRYFTIYRENPEISGQFVDALNMLHSSLMLDLMPFSPWKGDEQVLLHFFSTPETYEKITGRPHWSGGAASLNLRMIYLLEDNSLMGNTAHELSHIYFDAFFSPKLPPLWLSEGMAVLMQTGRAMSPPEWLGESLDRLRGGAGLPLSKLMTIQTLNSPSFTDEQVRLWYAQSYSLVQFLTKLSGPDSFYAFCKNLRDGKTPDQALLAAYGMPFNKVQALERAWRFDLKTGKITGLDR